MDSIQRQLVSGYPLLRIVGYEEDSAAAATVATCRTVLGSDTKVLKWDAAVGLEPARSGIETLDALLDMLAHEPGPTVAILFDAYLELSNAATRRRLLRLVPAIANRLVRVVLLSPPVDLDDELLHRLPTINYALPNSGSLQQIVGEELGGAEADEHAPLAMVAAALRGLTELETRATLRNALADGTNGLALLTRLFEAKARRIQGQALQYHPPDVSLDQIGGLAVLKEWAGLWAHDFRDPELSPLDAPKGVLLTGVSGCGKSFAIKALSHALAAPLFRLDMAQVFSRRNPEAAFASAIAAVEALSPCILWIDEIENALALGAQDTGPSTRIAGGFLTWMQERPPGTFLAATANRVELLPAELLRRGRFDQILFVDLPDEEERKRIWSVHLARRGLNPAHFDLIVLSRSTDGWSGAEIEAAIEAARTQTRAHQRTPGREDLLRAIGKTIPLSVTMQEQIKRVREWAFKRALPASGKPW